MNRRAHQTVQRRRPRKVKTQTQPLTLAIPQVADALGISRNSAYVQVKAGTIPSLKLGRRILVARSALERFLLEGPLVKAS